ncbi:Hypothetical predicted protein [Olea europaea subsp. europaea]|uniref:Translationally controlled tumor protein n=1 Tax=Olea europaea subsp. europaea TaxID=158383 RepID=A0A8S0V5U3_OLEEU|nr:Hypothetical predicted protein [Olea europaea subsp. europaea]
MSTLVPYAKGIYEEEGVDNVAVKVVDIVDTSNPLFDKKQFVAYMKKYIELLTPKLNAEKQAQLEKGIEGATNFLLSKLSDLQLRRLMTVVVS